MVLGNRRGLGSCPWSEPFRCWGTRRSSAPVPSLSHSGYELFWCLGTAGGSAPVPSSTSSSWRGAGTAPSGGCAGPCSLGHTGTLVLCRPTRSSHSGRFCCSPGPSGLTSPVSPRLSPGLLGALVPARAPGCCQRPQGHSVTLTQLPLPVPAEQTGGPSASPRVQDGTCRAARSDARGNRPSLRQGRAAAQSWTQSKPSSAGAQRPLPTAAASPGPAPPGSTFCHCTASPRCSWCWSRRDLDPQEPPTSHRQVLKRGPSCADANRVGVCGIAAPLHLLQPSAAPPALFRVRRRRFWH